MLQNRDTRQFGRYLVRGVLGVGGFATVYRAHDPVLDREVALKVLHPHLAHHAGTRERFVREWRALARVRHPNLVLVYDAGEVDGAAFLAMELVEGVQLDQRLASGPLSLADVTDIVAQVSGALAALHRRRIIHRDVKPANIMREPEGRAVLLDLGGARLLDATAATTAGYALGTPGYMAPEQIDPAGVVTSLTDVYQLGATAFALLTGHAPFRGNPHQLLYAVVHDPPPDPAATRPELTSTAAAALRQALAKQPAERPADALTFARLLRGSIDGHSAEPERNLGAEDAGVVHAIALGAEQDDAQAHPWSDEATVRQRLRASHAAPAPEPSPAPRPQAPGSAVPSAEARRRGGRSPAVVTVAALALVALSALGMAGGALVTRWALDSRGEGSPAQSEALAGAPSSSPSRSGSTAPTAPAATQSPSLTPASPSTTTPAPAAAPPTPALNAGRPPSVAGEWTFTDFVTYGPSTGSAYIFRVTLIQQGTHVSSSGDLALDGELEGTTLTARYRQGSSEGDFVWTFSEDGASFSGTFTSEGFGNGGDSRGRRAGSSPQGRMVPALPQEVIGLVLERRGKSEKRPAGRHD